MNPNDNQPVWRVAHGRSLPLDRDVLIMAVINVTPDSFSDGGLYAETEAAIAHGVMLAPHRRRHPGHRRRIHPARGRPGRAR